MPFPSQTFATLDDWESWVDLNIIPNGLQLITGDDGNITEHASVKFIRQSPLNWETAKIESGGGAINANRPVNVFISTIPDSLTWADNIYNQYIFINTTAGDIPLLGGTSYYDINLTETFIISAKSIVNIVKASNSLWIVASVPSSGSLASAPPYKGVVDRGQPNDPISGISSFQSNQLIGIGSTSNGEIQIVYGETVRSSFGINKSFDFDNVTGTIDLNYNSSGETWYSGSSLTVDRNQ